MARTKERPDDMSRMNISPTGFWDASTAHNFHTFSTPMVKGIAKLLADDKSTRLYDFGCGTGQYLARLDLMGFENLTGFEGQPPSVREFANIRQQDLTTPFKVEEPGNVICLEVAEHIPNEFETVFLQNIAGATKPGGKLVLSWAIRGQGGDGHINCRDNDEAIDVVCAQGFDFLSKETAALRGTIDPWPTENIALGLLWWFRNTSMIFEKTP
jgi:SAM-dependent methyltransferase